VLKKQVAELQKQLTELEKKDQVAVLTKRVAELEAQLTKVASSPASPLVTPLFHLQLQEQLDRNR